MQAGFWLKTSHDVLHVLRWHHFRWLQVWQHIRKWHCWRKRNDRYFLEILYIRNCHPARDLVYKTMKHFEAAGSPCMRHMMGPGANMDQAKAIDLNKLITKSSALTHPWSIFVSTIKAFAIYACAVELEYAIHWMRISKVSWWDTPARESPVSIPCSFRAWCSIREAAFQYKKPGPCTPKVKHRAENEEEPANVARLLLYYVLL